MKIEANLDNEGIMDISHQLNTFDSQKRVSLIRVGYFQPVLELMLNMARLKEPGKGNALSYMV